MIALLFYYGGMDLHNMSMIEFDESELSAKQELAIELVLRGTRDGEIAKQVGSAERQSTSGETKMRISALCWPSGGGNCANSTRTS